MGPSDFSIPPGPTSSTLSPSVNEPICSESCGQARDLSPYIRHQLLSAIWLTDVSMLPSNAGHFRDRPSSRKSSSSWTFHNNFTAPLLSLDRNFTGPSKVL